MAAARFNLQALFRAIEVARGNQGLSWASLSRQVGVSPATIRRYEDAVDAEADGVLALVRWLDEAPESFVDGISSAGVRLPAGDAFVRVDLDLAARASGSEALRSRNRLTIQQLVGVAEGSRQPIASLVRLSAV